MKILLAVDGSADSNLAVEEVLRRAWGSPTEIKVITVAETPVIVGMEPWAQTPEYFKQLASVVNEAAMKVIENALKMLTPLKEAGFVISSEIIEGSPKQVIVEEAERWRADLIVMGSRGLGAWNRLLLGSVSSAVVHHAKCSVEIVRRRETD